jgi:hypothetical protein
LTPITKQNCPNICSTMKIIEEYEPKSDFSLFYFVKVWEENLLYKHLKFFKDPKFFIIVYPLYTHMGGTSNNFFPNFGEEREKFESRENLMDYYY